MSKENIMTGNGTPKTTRELYFYIKGEFDNLRIKNESIQAELTEHKNVHWKVVTALIAGSSLYITSLTFLLNWIFKK